MKNQYHRFDGGDVIEPSTGLNGEGGLKSCGCDWRRRFFVLLTGCIIFLVLWAGWIMNISYFAPHRLSHVSSSPLGSFSPANIHVVYETRRTMRDGPDSFKFQGPPRPEVEKAWHDLLQGTLIRVSKEELEADKQNSVPLKSGGYGAGLGVSHNLHCLHRIHRYVHRSYYHDHSEQDWEELETHTDHCIESLRKAITCQADITLYPLSWTPASKLAPAVRMPNARSCVNFNTLHKWMLERAASMDDLIRPPDSFFDDQ